MAETPDGTAAPAKRPFLQPSRYLAALKVPLVLLCLIAAVVTAYYVFYVTRESEYLTERNFRVLATIGDHIERAIESNRTILSNIRDRGDALNQVQAQAARFIPILRAAKVVTWRENRPDASQVSDETMALQFVERSTLVEWTLRDESRGAGSPWQVRLMLDTVLEPLLRGPVEDGTFEALIVAGTDGHVVFQTGATTLRLANVAKVIPPPDPKAPAAVGFDQLAHAAGKTTVALAGDEYQVYTQPCCGLMASGTLTGWVLVGLTSQRSLRAQSFAVSFSIMAAILIVLLLAVLSWPFVKLFFIGESQRIKAHDVVLVGTSVLLGIAVITICALDLYAYGTLQDRLDAQLESFASDVELRARQEIDAALKQLARLDQAVDGPKFEPKFPDEHRVSDLAALLPDADLNIYPGFESFALVDENGEQRQKMSLGSYVTPLISVNDRDYFIHWTTGTAPKQPYFESIQSWTTGAREAVVSMRSRPGRVAVLSIPMRTLIDPVIVPGFGFVVMDDDGTVLFHSDPQHSLSENFYLESDRNQRLRALAIARHREWVDIKYWGDDHRAFVSPITLGDRSFTLITFYDQDNVRAVNIDWLVITGAFLMLYTSAYMAVCLTILILRPKYRAPWLWPDPVRSKEYLDLAPSLLLLATAFAVAIAILPPRELMLFAGLVPVVAWLGVYATLARCHDWRRLAGPAVGIVVLLIALLVVTWRNGGGLARALLTLLLAGGVAEAAVAVWRQVTHRRAALAPPVAISYGVAAALLAIITSVLPAAAFFRAGYAVQIESFIKYGQLRLALDRIEHARRADDLVATQVPSTSIDRVRRLRASDPRATEWGIYQRFFFGTTPLDEASVRATCAPADAAGASAAAHQDATDDRTLAETVEEYLPFYSKLSVNLREMVHDRASDNRWYWRRSAHGLTFCAPSPAPIGLTSTVPPFFDASASSLMAQRPFALLVFGVVILLGVVVWAVRFITDKVFVADVVEPLSADNGATLHEGWAPNLFLVGPAPSAADVSAAACTAIDLNDAPRDKAARAAWFNEQFRRTRQSPPDRHVLVLHFERRDDAAHAQQKLVLLDDLVSTVNRPVVVVSAVAPAPDEIPSRFSVVPIAPRATAAAVAADDVPASMLKGWTGAGWREIVWRLNALGFSRSATFLAHEREDAHVDRLWRDVLPYAWHPDRPPLDVGQLLIEVGERAEQHYAAIWSRCTREEKLVLGHLAEEGLVNYKTKKTLRRLLARGLVRRQPHFVLMNETFRQFVLSPAPRQDVAALEENSTTSAWDAIRLPFTALLFASLAFMFATQHELFNTTMGMITAVVAAVPAIVQMANLFGVRRAADD
jgi:hypothetical protein